MFDKRRFFTVFIFSTLFLGLVVTVFLSLRPGGAFDTRKRAAENSPSLGRLSPQVITAQVVGENIDEKKPAILTVVGEGKVKATPEQAQFTISYSSSGNSPSAAIEAEKAIRQKITSLLNTSYSVDTTDIRASFPSIVQTGTSPNISYSSVNSMGVTFKKLADLDKAISKIYEIGPVSIGNIIFTTNNPRNLEDQAINNALYDAQMRAAKMAESSGAKLGRLVAITGQQTQAVGAVTREANKPNDLGGVPGQIELTRTVTLVYELK